MLVSSAAGQDFIRAYDLHGRLQITRPWAPSVRAHGLFTPPHRVSARLLNARAIGCCPVVATTEVTSSRLGLSLADVPAQAWSGQAADVYIGDASSQVYEFIRTPRPCIFLNPARIGWRSDPAYSHWHFGQVIESADDLPSALARAPELQPQFEQAQRNMSAASIDCSNVPDA